MKRPGFTLIELLIVVGIIAILVAVVLVALNPLELFSESRNSQRWVKVSEFLTATHVYTVQNKGIVPNREEWDEDVYFVLGTSSTGCKNTCGELEVADRCLDLSDMIESKRISSIPVDPLIGTEGNTGFYIHRTEGTIITVGACHGELEEKIEVSR